MTRLTGHLVAATERHSSQKLSLHPDAIQIKRHGEIRQTCETYWRTKQGNPDPSMDHVGAPRPTTNTVAPDTTPARPNTADNAPLSYAVILLNTEAPHTRYASLTK